jgi:hypothetical protein
MATAKDVMKMISDNEVLFVDFRFTDTRGKEQHVTVPVSHFDEDKFISGHAFDGSSVAGWKGIEASDMQLMPDANTANIDPFFEETTLFLSCDVVEPSDGKAYDRDPRSIAKRAEAYLKASGLGDVAYEPNDNVDRLLWLYPQVRLLMNSPSIEVLRWVQRAFPGVKSPGVQDSHPLMKLPTEKLLTEKQEPTS